MYYDESNFIPVEAAVKYISSHTRNNPTIDMKRMMKGYNYITRSRGTAYNIFLVEKVGDVVRPAGEIATVLKTTYDVELIKKTLTEKYREIAGAEFDEQMHQMKASTSVVDNGGDAMPRKSDPIAQPNQVVGNTSAPTIKVDSMNGQYGALATGIDPRG